MPIGAERRLMLILEEILPPSLSGRLVEIGGLNPAWMNGAVGQADSGGRGVLVELNLADSAEDPLEEPSDTLRRFGEEKEGEGKS